MTYRRRGRLHPIVSIAMVGLLLLSLVIIASFWNTINLNAEKALIIQSVKIDDYDLTVYVQNIGEGNITLNKVQIDELFYTIDDKMCKVNGYPSTEVMKNKVAVISIELHIESITRVKVITKNGFSAIWNMP